jgi:transposase
MSASEKMPHKIPDELNRSPAPADPDGDSRSREQLLEQIEYLQMEVAYLKKLRALIQSQQKQQAPRKKRKS